MTVTSSRSVVEQAYSSHSQFRNIRKHEAIEYQMLEPLDNLCPYFASQTKWWMLSMFAWNMINKYYRPFSQTFDLPPGYTYASVGTTMRNRIAFRNPYLCINSFRGCVLTRGKVVGLNKRKEEMMTISVKSSSRAFFFIIFKISRLM